MKRKLDERKGLLPSQVPSTYTKSIPFAPSTIDNVDAAMLDYVENKLNIFTTTHKGFERVPVVWVSPERGFSAKKDRLFRDSTGALILPIISIERTNVAKDLSKKGSIWGNVVPVADEKGGSIRVARRIKHDKTSNFINAESQRRKGQVNFPGYRPNKIVYETVSIPLPVYVEVTYKINIRTEYQEQMNDVVTPFITKPGGVNYILIEKENHRYEGFIQQDFNQNNNYNSFTNEERKVETTIEIKVLAYLIGEKGNQEQPRYAIRENAVSVKIPRERIVFGDEPEFEEGRYYGLAGLASLKLVDEQQFILSSDTRPGPPLVNKKVDTGTSFTSGNPITTDNYIARTEFKIPAGGVGDNSTTRFVTFHTFVSGSEMVFRDGILMKPGQADDYIIVNDSMIQFAEAPDVDENMLISYIISSK
jgi:hypothetical protein